MDRGFELMIPQPKEAAKRRYDFKQSIRFTLFNREFHLYFSVKQTPE